MSAVPRKQFLNSFQCLPQNPYILIQTNTVTYLHLRKLIPIPLYQFPKETMESYVLGGYTFKSTWPRLFSPFTYCHSDLQIRSMVPSPHPKEHPFLRASFSSHVNIGCKPLSQQGLAPLICIRRCGHLERLRGPHVSHRPPRVGLSPALSDCLLDRQGKLGPVAALFITETKSSAMRGEEDEEKEFCQA